MDIELYRKHLIEKADLFKPHFEQITILKKMFDDVQNDLRELSILSLDSIEALDRIVVESILDSNTEIVTSLVHSLVDNKLSTVDVLSRTAIEFSVNVLYILKAESDFGAREFLDNYMVHHSTKLRKWRDYRITAGSKFEYPSALYERFLLTKVNSDKILDLKGRKWPNARMRFKDCELEDDYVTLYSTVSDSVHSMGEDTYNYFLASLSGASEFRNELMRYQMYERKSFSVYLSWSALRFYVQVLCYICIKGEQGYLKNKMDHHLNQIVGFINDHDDHQLQIAKQFNSFP